MLEHDRNIAKERQKADYYKKGRPIPPLAVGDPVSIQNPKTRRWDRYGVIQERQLQTRKYTIRLSSGLITTRNRRHIVYRQLYPEPVPVSGRPSLTSHPSPLRKPWWRTKRMMTG